MNKFAKHFLLIVVTSGVVLLTYSCGPKYFETLIPRLQPQSRELVEKFPYKIAFVVDEKSLNEIRVINYRGAMFIYSAMGRALNIQYKEFLDKHFEGASIVWGTDQKVLKKYDLKTKILIDDYYAEIPFFAGISEGTFHMAVTFLIEPIDGLAIIKKTMTDTETGKFFTITKNQDLQLAFFKAAVNRYTADAVNNMLSKFSLELQASPKLHIFDFKDMEGFLGVLDASATPMSKFICSKLSPFVRDALHEFAKDSNKDTSEKSEKSNIPPFLEIGIIDQLNTILAKETLRDAALQSGIKVSDEKGRYALNQDKMHMNRLLFDQAYNQYIEKFDTSIHEKLKSLHAKTEHKTP